VVIFHTIGWWQKLATLVLKGGLSYDSLLTPHFENRLSCELSLGGRGKHNVLQSSPNRRSLSNGERYGIFT